MATALKPVLPTIALAKLQTIERDLLTLLLEREEVVRAALLALLARQHFVQLGAPGAAKTLLMTELAKRITNELEALWDRFLLRVKVGYLSGGGFAQFI